MLILILTVMIVYAKFEEEYPREIYFHGSSGPFSTSVRLKLIYYMLEAPRRNHGCGLEIEKLIHKKKIVGFYPLHNTAIAHNLMVNQIDFSTLPWKQPIEDIRAYYGEKIALYNVFLGHYTLYLIIPSIIGLAFQLVVWGTLNFSHPVLPFFGVIITLWAIGMLEGWKRKEAITAMEWGMSSFESSEIDRPEFQGEPRTSHIDGTEILYFPPDSLNERLAQSFSVVVTFILIVIGVVAGIYQMRISLQPQIGAYASTLASVINTVQIQIFNIIYQYLVRSLTDLENHRTDTQYADSVIIKIFLFQFVNSYASFFYLAFIASYLVKPDGVPENYVGQCGYTNCMQPLSVNLAIIFGSRLVVTNLLNLLIPFVDVTLKIRKETIIKSTQSRVNFEDLTPAEKDYMLLPYDSMFDSVSNYADTAIQYGFMVLFITALPCACFFSMVNSYAKLRISAYIQTKVRLK